MISISLPILLEKSFEIFSETDKISESRFFRQKFMVET